MPRYSYIQLHTCGQPEMKKKNNFDWNMASEVASYLVGFHFSHAPASTNKSLTYWVVAKA